METQTWQAIESGSDLDQLIAARLGIKAVFSTASGHFYLQDFHDDRISGGATNEERLWGIAFRTGLVPRYSTNTDAAWALLPLDRHIRVIRHTDRGGSAVGMPNEIGVEIWNCTTETPILEAVGFGDRLALAMCRGWLAWMDKRSASG